MVSAYLVACLCCGLQLAGAMREYSRSASARSESLSNVNTGEGKGKGSWSYEGEEDPVQECIYAGDVVLQCPNKGQRVGVVTAFWNRRKRYGCRGEDRDISDTAGLNCNPNATDQVIDICKRQGGTSCTLPGGFTGCEENPFTFMRVRWRCDSGAGFIKATPTTTTTTEPTTTTTPEDLKVSEEKDEDEKEKEPVIPPKKATKDDPDVEEWRTRPNVRLIAPSLNQDNCNGLHVGAMGVCQLSSKVGGFASSPHFDRESVCKCRFLTPLKNMRMSCDKLFSHPDDIYKTVSRHGMSIAIFGKEGCDCHMHPTEKGWTECDLAVREA